MRRSVFVHVGAPAAGATFLRRRLAANEATLSEAGIALVQPRDPADRSPENLAVRALAADHPTVLVSDDRLAGASTEDIERLLGALADHLVHVVYGAVDLGTAIVSEWQRDVGSTDEDVFLDTWIDGLVGGEHSSFWRTYGLVDVLTRWAVPAGRLHVVVTPPGPDPATELWARFAAVIGARRDLVDVAAPGDGMLTAEALELRRRVGLRLNDSSRAAAARRLVDELVAGARGPDGARPLLPLRHRPWINQQSSLHRKYLEAADVEIVGDPADLEVDDDRYGAAETALDDEAMLTMAVEAGAALVRRLIAGREQRGPGVAVPDPTQGLAVPPKPALVDRARRKVSHAYASAKGEVRRARHRVVNRRRRTYYLHIGAPKCGSSYLQSLLWRNRDALMRGGVYVPGRAHADHFAAGTDFRGRPYVTQTAEGAWRGAWDRLVDDAERSGYGKIVISSEFLSSADPDVIAPRIERLAGDDIQVVYAVREFAGLLGSVWQQTVRTARTAPWPEWLDWLAGKRATDWMWTQHNVGRILDGWTREGVTQVHVLTVPRHGTDPGELWRRFGSIVGWRARTTTKAPRGNESLGYAQAEVLRRLQELLVDVEPRTHRARVTKNLIGDLTLAPMDRIDRLVIPERLRPWVESESARQCDAITRSSANVIGDLGDLVLDDARFSPEPIVPDQTAMIDAAVAVVARLARAVVREEAAMAPAGSGAAP